MPRYIDADKIISHLNDEIESCGDHDVDYQPVTYGTYLGLKYAKSFVETAETADVQEVRHGTWGNYEEYSDGYRCSCCKLISRTCTAYCPHCGACMDGKEQEMVGDAE